MGDYSRDTFKLTNVLHHIISGDAVVQPRHYVGVKLQQGVPLLDADWNDADDIRRREAELLMRDFIGNGVAGTGTGFAIAQVEADNDFIIQAGVLLLGGWQVINGAPIRYSELPRFYDDDNNFLGIDLNEPAGDRSDIVYLDVYEEEIAASGEHADTRLVNASIGLETANRVERRWTVRVEENVSDFSSLTLNTPGHQYYPLARLYRSGTPRIEAYMIEDQRRLGLTLADGIKAPLYLQRGTEVINPTRFTDMLVDLRNNLKYWQQNELFPVLTSSFEAQISYLNVFNEVYFLSSSAEINSDTRNLDNNDALLVIEKLADAQQNMIDTFRTFGGSNPALIANLDRYEDYLDGDPAQNIDGIRPPLTNQDLLGAVQGQEELNDFLLMYTGDLPQGTVSAVLQNVTPGSAITTGQMTLRYTITSGLTSPATAEVFDLQVTVSDVRWAHSLPQAQVTLAPGASTEVDVSIDPGNTLVAGDFADINLVVSAHRRPSLQSTQVAQRFTIGQLPPVASFFYYNDEPLVGNRHEVSEAEIEQLPYQIHFTLANSTGGLPGGQQQRFDIVYELVFPASQPGGITINPADWYPATPRTLTGQNVDGASADVILTISAPNLNYIVSSTDILFTLRATATLTHLGGTPVTGGKSHTENLPVRLVITRP